MRPWRALWNGQPAGAADAETARGIQEVLEGQERDAQLTGRRNPRTASHGLRPSQAPNLAGVEEQERAAHADRPAKQKQALRAPFPRCYRLQISAE